MNHTDCVICLFLRCTEQWVDQSAIGYTYIYVERDTHVVWAAEASFASLPSKARVAAVTKSLVPWVASL